MDEHLHNLARRFIEKRRFGFALWEAIDEEALAFARRVQLRQPRADYTIVELPATATVQPTDLFIIFRPGVGPGGGQTYQVTAEVAQLAVLPQAGTIANVPMDGSSVVPVTFPVAFGVVPVVTTGCLDTTNANISIKVSTKTLTGFFVGGLGGAPGSTASVDWMALPATP